jgi:hypothetical protein
MGSPVAFIIGYVKNQGKKDIIAYISRKNSSLARVFAQALGPGKTETGAT